MFNFNFNLPHVAFLALFIIFFLLWFFFSDPNTNEEIGKNVGEVVDHVLDKCLDKKPKKENKQNIDQNVPSTSQNPIFKSKGERECKRVMEKIYGKPFFTVRPDWLKNPITKRNLELDCFNEELAIAVEYNGEQHYNWPNFTNCTHQQFISQLQRDKLKSRLCKKRGVYLIVVPYTIQHNNIERFILDNLP